MTVKLKDMRLSKSDKEEIRETAVASDPPEFPFGLRIHLNEESIEKLNMGKLPSPGSEMMAMVKLRVESASINKTEEKMDRNLSLQITKMGIKNVDEDIEEESERVDESGDGPPKPTAEEVLFTS